MISVGDRKKLNRRERYLRAIACKRGMAGDPGGLFGDVIRWSRG